MKCWRASRCASRHSPAACATMLCEAASTNTKDLKLRLGDRASLRKENSMHAKTAWLAAALLVMSAVASAQSDAGSAGQASGAGSQASQSSQSSQSSDAAQSGGAKHS